VRTKTWVIRLRNLPDAPETYYLMELMGVSRLSKPHCTTTSTLEDPAVETQCLEDQPLMLSTISSGCAGQNYEPLLPEVDAQFRELDSRIHIRVEQRKHLAERLQAMADRTAARLSGHWGGADRRANASHASRNGSVTSDDPPIARTSATRGPPARARLTWRLGDPVQRPADRGICTPERTESTS